MDFITQGSALNHDILLAILSHLTVRDILAMRQVRNTLVREISSVIDLALVGLRYARCSEI